MASEGILASFEHARIGRYRAMAHPLRFGGSPAPAPFAAPAMGEDTREILTWLGYSAADIDRLCRSRAVVGPAEDTQG